MNIISNSSANIIEILSIKNDDTQVSKQRTKIDIYISKIEEEKF